MAECNVRLRGEFTCCVRYYTNSECPRGDLCPYNHIRGPDILSCRFPYDNDEIGFVTVNADFIAANKLKANHLEYCYYYSKGHCHYGSSCRYPHLRLTNEEGNDLLSRVPSSTPINNNWRSNLQPSTSTTPLLSSQKSKTHTSIGRAEASKNLLEMRKSAMPPSLLLPHTITSGALNKEEWANAPEFVPKTRPKPRSYADIVGLEQARRADPRDAKLCPYAEKDGVCKIPPGECAYLHGDLCDLCGRAVLHPNNEELRKKHTQECIKQHERNMEHSFAVARSLEKTCGVCFEVIMEKSSGEKRFGILPNCNHCFCLTCIRKWRQARQFENKIIRACPECRVTSDFVCPSMYWVETKEEKEKLINDYKLALSNKDCKYFRMGLGKCPFGNKCFYRHARRDGTVVDVGPPPRRRLSHLCRHHQRQLQQHSQQGGNMGMFQHIILWDFFEERDEHWFDTLADHLDDIVAFLSDSDDSDWSDYDFFFSD